MIPLLLFPGLSSFLNNKAFILFDTANPMVIYNSSTCVMKSLNITIAKPVQLVIGAPLNQMLSIAPGTRLGDIELLKEYFESKLYALTNSSGQDSLLQASTLVYYDTYISIERLKTIEVVVKPDESGTISIDEVRSDIIGIIEGSKDVISDISVIKDGENGFIIIITVVDKNTESVVDALKRCMD